MASPSPPASPSEIRVEGNDTVRQVNPQDCLPCRLTGATAMVGLGTYALLSGRQQLFKERLTYKPWEFRLRKASIHGLSAGLILAGLYRLVN